MRFDIQMMLQIMAESKQTDWQDRCVCGALPKSICSSVDPDVGEILLFFPEHNLFIKHFPSVRLFHADSCSLYSQSILNLFSSFVSVLHKVLIQFHF